jgi:hypothetical protein
MSSKSSNDKYEPIKLDTTILKIDIKSNGDLITKEFDLLPFHPNMSDMKDLSNNNYILFPSFVKITMNYLKQAGIGQDYKKAFTDLDKYIKLIKFVTKPDKEVDEDFTLLVDQTQYKNFAMSFVQDFTSDITNDFRSVQKYEPLTDAEIITNNIGILKNIFLPVNGRFFVLGHEYIINESKYLPPFKASDSLNEHLTERKKVPLNYTITVELQLLDVIKNPGMGDFSKLSCKQKQINLKKDMKEIFGDSLSKSFGYKEEVKVTLPPLTPTTTSKRGFGKLQLEWEERNKYIKAPTTEKERLEQEAKWSPLQKKLAQYDKYQEEYNKIPPLWIKDTKEMNVKHETFEKNMLAFVKEIKDIKDVNTDYNETTKEPSFVKDLIDSVQTKMIETVGELLALDDKIKYAAAIKEKIKKDEAGKIVVPDNETLLKAVIQEKAEQIAQTEAQAEAKAKATDPALKALIDNYNDNKKINNTDDLLLKQMVDLNTAIKLRDEFILGNKYSKENNPIYKAEESYINNKYVEPFLVDMKEREKDVNELIKAVQNMNNEITKSKEKGDTYEIGGIQQERAKLQAILLKKQTDLKVLQSKYGPTGETLIKDKWKPALNKMESLKNNIEADKVVGEKTILNDSVSKELDAKLKEIKKLKEKLYKAMYFEGVYAELTKDETNTFSKKPGDKPIENVSQLERNISTLKDEYLEIANKLGITNQVQGWITLLNEDLSRIKVLKKGKEKEKLEKDSEIKKISSELKNIADTKRKSPHAAEINAQEKIVSEAKKNSETAKTLTTPEKDGKIAEADQRLKEEETKLKELEDKDRTDREKTLITEQEKLQSKIKLFIQAIDDIKIFEKLYNDEITRLKKERNITTETIKKSKETIDTTITNFKAKIETVEHDIENLAEGGGQGKRTQRRYKHKLLKKTKRRGKKIYKSKSLQKRWQYVKKQQKKTKRRAY